MSLKYLFKKYKSDKYFHNYHNVYEHFLHKFKKKKLKILEIGVSDGSSIKAWSEYFKSSLIIGIDIKKIDIKKRKLKKKNIHVLEGSQSDPKFINSLINKYKKFDVIIDDGSHFPKDVIKSFKLLFHSLDKNGLYFIEDTQTSYNHYFGGNPFDLKFANTHVNFFKHLTDTLNYNEIANPFYKKTGYDGSINNISFYNNIITIKKGINNKKSNLVLNNSYENKRYATKIKRSGGEGKIKFFIKYMIIFKLFTYAFFLINFFKKIILFRY